MDDVTILLGKRPDQIAVLLGRPCPVVPENAEPDDRQYIDLPDFGMSIVLGEDGKADTVQLYGPGNDDDYATYLGRFHPSLDFYATREQVRQTLGMPVRMDVGGAGKRLFGEYMNPWDLFIVGGRALHCEYTPDATGIQLVSISETAT